MGTRRDGAGVSDSAKEVPDDGAGGAVARPLLQHNLEGKCGDSGAVGHAHHWVNHAAEQPVVKVLEGERVLQEEALEGGHFCVIKY